MSERSRPRSSTWRPRIHACCLIAAADISDLKGQETATAQLAVNALVEKRECADSTLPLKAHARRASVLDWKQGLLADALALVPRLAMSTICCGFLEQAGAHAADGRLPDRHPLPIAQARAAGSRVFFRADRV